MSGEHCNGGGCLPNAEMAYRECGWCAGVGRVHVGCTEESYADLVAAVRERDNTIARVREVHERNYGFPTVNGVRLADARPVVYCDHCQVDWPCATIAALDPQETP